MLIKNYQTKTAVIVVHEIYGINRHMKGICQLLKGIWI